MPKRKLFTATLCILLTAAILFPTAAFAADNSRFKGNTASADFYSMPDECTEQYAWVYAVEEKQHQPPGPPETGQWVDVHVSTFNYCTNTGTYAYGGKFMESDEFQFDKKLNSASLNTTVTATQYDYWYGTEIGSVDIAVQLDWTGEGDVYKGQSSYRYKVGNCMYRDRYTGSDRYAEPSGSISDGMTEYAASPDYAYGYLTLTKNGSTVVNCY